MPVNLVFIISVAYTKQILRLNTLTCTWLILATMVHFSTNGQPNITRSLFIKEKICSKENKGWFNHISIGNRIYGTSILSHAKSSTSGIDGGLVVLNQNFDTVRTFCYGGSGEDRLLQISLLPNGHLLLSGATTSKDMDLATYAHAYSAKEIWLLEVDTLGNIIKGRTFGGSGGSDLWRTILSSDGYIYSVGTTLAKDYDFAHFSYGIFDEEAWIVKLDTAFQIQWAKLPPGNDTDLCTGIEEVNSNRFYLVFGTRSTNIELAGNLAKGSLDLMVMFIDSNGTELWKKRYGGSSVDAPDKCLIDTLSKHLYVAGRTKSADGDITYRTGTSLVWGVSYNTNIWLTKIDTLGTVLYSKAYGSVTNSVEDVTAVTFFDNKLWIGSHYVWGGDDLESPEPPISDSVTNAWIGIADTNLNLICKYTIRSNCSPRVFDFFTFKSNLYATGFTRPCNSGTITNTFSCDTLKEFDFILNLSDAPLGLKDVGRNLFPLFELYPNPVENMLHIKFLQSANSEKYTVSIFNAEGKVVYRKQTKRDLHIESSLWPRGYYAILVERKGERETQSFLKQ